MKLKKPARVLILVPRIVLQQNWQDEIDKWYPECDSIITAACYDSIEKHSGYWDMVIFDEAHHLSDRCREVLVNSYKIDTAIFLSATMPYALINDLKLIFRDLEVLKVSMKQAISSDTLPPPMIYLIPLHLDCTHSTETYTKNPKGKETKHINYSARWEATRNKKYKYIISCTQAEYYQYLSDMVEWYKKQFLSSQNIGLKHLWLRASLDRLQFLSRAKLGATKKILNYILPFEGIRSLTFCANIKQTEHFLPIQSITSKNKDNTEVIKQFNEGDINHITAVNCLNEGVNLVNCRIGIFNVINASEIMNIQKIGRILRHPEPILIIPFFKGTREEEIVNKITSEHNSDKIKTILSLNEIKL
jgi:superfamily II DNA or RNA helicase